ncbi:transcription initiation factor TFIID subunit 4 isoform X2 [Toxorhynchites rutilus septentrionalis]|uniref:transcription initiation factor TFIID subunit 4 isoform X2 n=1 Tax=Toxorhynchites rutilus septentrionalis TaxID=329112 RepID=UPI00247ACAA9|nr:transcription initiation factor TFIID subunit 4 isoform X2 [Toxorhynchites rutilus septentrionalis]
MASANFLEEALKSDVDESAVNAIVGTLENQLDQSSADQVQQVAKNFECGNSGNSLNSEIVSNGGATPIYSSVQQQQKHSNHGVTNGEIVSNVMNSNGNNNNNINSKTYFISSSVGQNVINSVGSGATTVVVGKNITASAAGIPPSSTPPALIKTVPTVSSSSGISIISNQIVVSAGGQPPPPFNVPTSNNNNNSQYQSNMPKNEPVKLVYPSPGGGTGTPNAGTQAVLNMNNNRVTLTSTSLPNGTISLTQTPQLIQTGGAGGKTTIQATGQPGNPGQHQGQTLIIKNQQTGAVMNTGAPGIVTMTKPINNQATQNIVGLPAGVQIVNVRPGAPPTQAQQKTVAAVSPRVVIGSQQIVSTRPPNANAITLSALQGQPGSTLLLKNEQGQFQLLRIGPAPAGAQITPANLTATSATNQTIRLQTVPAVSRFTGPPLALRKTIVTTQQVKQKQNPISSGSGTIIVNSQSITNTPTSYVTTQSTPVASVAPVPALAAQQHITISTAQSPASAVATGQPTVVATQHPQTTVMTTQQPQQPQQLGSGGQQATQTVVVTTTTGQTAQQRNSLDNTKEKCRKFLTNLIELSKREPKPVEKNVRTLIQELVDANVEPEEFCERLERLLNASPQPCLIGFLKKSLPLLRQSLVTKEITIEGINPPSANVAFSGSPLTQIPAQIRPVTQTIVTQNSMVGQTQIRMLTTQSSGTTVPRIGQTTIRPAAPVRIQTPIQQHQTTTSVPRQITTQHIRPNATATVGHTTIVQTSQQLPQTISTTPPALLPIRAPAGTAITRTPATLQIRATTPVVSRTVATNNNAASGNTTVTTKTIRGQSPAVVSVAAAAAAAAAAASGSAATQVKQVTALSNSNMVVAATSAVASPPTAPGTPGLVVTGTQPLPALALSSSAAAAVATLNNANNSSHSTSIISTSIPSATTVVVSSGPATAAGSNNTTGNHSTSSNTAHIMNTSSSSTVTVSHNKTSVGTKSQNSSAGAKKKASASSAAGSADSADPSAAAKKAAASMQSSFYQHHVSSSMYGDDDINDVAAMGGVNLAEETQRILGSTEFVGTQIRSCKDEVFLHLPALQAKIRSIIARHGLEEPNSEVAVLISHACQERLKNVVEKLAVIAEHRIDIIKVDPRYEVTKDVRGQIKFLEELDKAEQKRHEEQEREMLMRAAKSRSKTEDPEQAKLKAKAKEMQRAEMEELRQRDANLTALQAIGPRKKPKLEEGATAPVTPGASGIGVVSGKASTSLRPRIKRVNLRDMLFYLEQEKESCRSQMLYKAYLK